MARVPPGEPHHADVPANPDGPPAPPPPPRRGIQCGPGGTHEVRAPHRFHGSSRGTFLHDRAPAALVVPFACPVPSGQGEPLRPHAGRFLPGPLRFGHLRRLLPAAHRDSRRIPRVEKRPLGTDPAVVLGAAESFIRDHPPRHRPGTGKAVPDHPPPASLPDRGRSGGVPRGRLLPLVQLRALGPESRCLRQPRTDLGRGGVRASGDRTRAMGLPAATGGGRTGGQREEGRGHPAEDLRGADPPEGRRPHRRRPGWHRRVRHPVGAGGAGRGPGLGPVGLPEGNGLHGPGSAHQPPAPGSALRIHRLQRVLRPGRVRLHGLPSQSGPARRVLQRIRPGFDDRPVRGDRHRRIGVRLVRLCPAHPAHRHRLPQVLREPGRHRARVRQQYDPVPGDEHPHQRQLRLPGERHHLGHRRGVQGERRRRLDRSGVEAAAGPGSPSRRRAAGGPSRSAGDAGFEDSRYFGASTAGSASSGRSSTVQMLRGSVR